MVDLIAAEKIMVSRRRKVVDQSIIATESALMKTRGLIAHQLLTIISVFV